MYSIAVIAVPASLRNITRIKAQMQQYCNVTFLSYTSRQDLIATYQRSLKDYDAFLFGGSYTYHLLRECVLRIKKPFDFFDIEDRDYYRIIAELAIEQPGIDFSRVYMDEPAIHVNFETIFHRSGVPLQLPNMRPEDGYDSMWDISLQRYQTLWSENKADLIVTRFGSMADELTARGIRYRLLLPSEETMMNTFWNLLRRLKENALQGASTCIGIVQPMENAQTDLSYEERLVLLRQTLHEFNASVGDLFLIGDTRIHLELTTTSTTLQECTRNLTICPLLALCQRTLSFPVFIGWGCGSDVIEAHRNAEQALQQSARHDTFASYAITEDDTVIGPLPPILYAGSEFSASEIPTSRQSSQGISSRNLSEIKRIMQEQQEPILSAPELAESLSITVRSASRILRRFEDMGVAQAFIKKSSTHIGRPVKYYRFDLRMLMAVRE